MNIDNLKANWNALEEKLQSSQLLTEQIVLTMIKYRSQSTITSVQRKLDKVALFFAGLLALFFAIVVGNPFDYSQWFEYAPAVLYALLIVFALKVIIFQKIEIRGVALSNSNLRESLQKIISITEKYQVTMERVWHISLVAGVFLGLSLMVRNFESYGWVKSILIIIANVLTVIILFTIARLILKQLPDAQLTALKMNLAELDEI